MGNRLCPDRFVLRTLILHILFRVVCVSETLLYLCTCFCLCSSGMNSATTIAVSLGCLLLSPLGLPSYTSQTCTGLGPLWLCWGSPLSSGGSDSVSSVVDCHCHWGQSTALNSTCSSSALISVEPRQTLSWWALVGSFILFDCLIVGLGLSIRFRNQRRLLRRGPPSSNAILDQAVAVPEVHNRRELVARAKSAMRSAGIRVHALDSR